MHLSVDYEDKGVITDDSLGALISRISTRTRVSVLMDCCHSGTCLDLPYRYVGHRTIDACSRSKYRVYHPQTVMISGCMDEQTSADAFDQNRDEYTGAMTSAFLDALKIEPSLAHDTFALVVTMRALLNERRMPQIPQLCSSKAAAFDHIAFFPHELR